MRIIVGDGLDATVIDSHGAGDGIRIYVSHEGADSAYVAPGNIRDFARAIALLTSEIKER